MNCGNGKVMLGLQAPISIFSVRSSPSDLPLPKRERRASVIGSLGGHTSQAASLWMVPVQSSL